MTQQILIIEDDSDTRLGLTIRFRANGFGTLLAVDGVAGLMAAQRDKPDLIMLDLGLPGGDGFVVLQRLKANANTESIPVIVLSARDPTVNRPKALELGAEAYFQKPTESEQLMAEVRRHLGETIIAAPVTKQRKVLIVEDDADTRRGVSVRLKSAGYETGFATDGLTAISATAREKPDAIILDLGLPAGDGFTVLQRLRMNPALCSIPVIVISGREASQISSMVRGLGAKAYLQKPIDNDLLLTTLEQVVGHEAALV